MSPIKWVVLEPSSGVAGRVRWGGPCKTPSIALRKGEPLFWLWGLSEARDGVDRVPALIQLPVGRADI